MAHEALVSGAIGVSTGTAYPPASCASTEEIIEVWEKDPSVQAFTDLMNRTLDKPAEQVKVTGADDGPVTLSIEAPWLRPLKR